MGETKNILHFEKISTKCSLESFSTDKNSDCWISILRLKSGLVRMDSLFIDNAYSTLIWCIKILHYSILYYGNTIKEGHYPLPVDNTHERHAVVTTFRRAQRRLWDLSSMKNSKFSTLILIYQGGKSPGFWLFWAKSQQSVLNWLSEHEYQFESVGHTNTVCSAVMRI